MICIYLEAMNVGGRNGKWQNRSIEKYILYIHTNRVPIFGQKKKIESQFSIIFVLSVSDIFHVELPPSPSATSFKSTSAAALFRVSPPLPSHLI